MANEGWRTPTPYEWIAELADESDEAGAVVVRRANGDMSGCIWIPTVEMFKQLRDLGTEFESREMQYRGPDVVVLPPTLAHLKP